MISSSSASNINMPKRFNRISKRKNDSSSSNHSSKLRVSLLHQMNVILEENLRCQFEEALDFFHESSETNPMLQSIDVSETAYPSAFSDFEDEDTTTLTTDFDSMQGSQLEFLQSLDMQTSKPLSLLDEPMKRSQSRPLRFLGAGASFNSEMNDVFELLPKKIEEPVADSSIQELPVQKEDSMEKSVKVELPVTSSLLLRRKLRNLQNH